MNLFSLSIFLILIKGNLYIFVKNYLVIETLLHHKLIPHQSSNEWVTFIHGAGGSSSIWYKQLREFTKHFNVLLIDLRGHGSSKNISLKKIKKYTFRSLTLDVKEVLDHHKIKGSHFVGISLGTIIIRELVEINASYVKSMILGGAITRLNFKSQILMYIGNAFKSVIPYILLYKLFAFIIMPKKSHKKSRNLFIQEAKKLYQKEFIRWFRLTAHINPLLRLHREKDPGVPALYIMGSEDHMFLNNAINTAKKHMKSTLEIIEKCGHVVNVDRPQEFNRLCLKFITTNSNFVPAK